MGLWKGEKMKKISALTIISRLTTLLIIVGVLYLIFGMPKKEKKPTVFEQKLIDKYGAEYEQSKEYYSGYGDAIRWSEDHLDQLLGFSSYFDQVAEDSYNDGYSDGYDDGYNANH